MSYLILYLHRSWQSTMSWTAHQLVDLRVSAAGLALSAVALGLATTPLLATRQSLLAMSFIVFYRLLSTLSGSVSRALGHFDARQRYLRPFMEIVLILSVMVGLSLYQPERLFQPALVLIITVLVFDLERRLAGLLQKAQGVVVNAGKLECLVDIATGSVGRTLLLLSACYWPQGFFWSGFGFAGFCLMVLVWRLILNYRRLATSSETMAPVSGDEILSGDASVPVVSPSSKLRKQA